MNAKLSILSLALVMTGCASITRGTKEAFVIETTPPGATATLSDGMTCQTPCSVKVKRRGDFVVTLEKAGYETIESTVTSSVDGAGAAGMAGNVLVGGIIGAGIDAGTGAMHSHKPNPLSVTLVPAGEAVQEAASAPAETGDDTPLSDEERDYVPVTDTAATENR
ncbi:MAG: PEGA domain-containing protein [Gammaproteobacteria bacterium]|nr:PEGA domain-containing protein [Gammaproteobacteria bacterium]